MEEKGKIFHLNSGAEFFRGAKSGRLSCHVEGSLWPFTAVQQKDVPI